MARINIEDDLYKDIRFINFVHMKGGSIDKALGNVVRAFTLAQKHFLCVENDRLIPLPDWKKAMIGDDIIKANLAELRPKGVYVMGSENQFKWLIQRQKAGSSPKKPRDKPESPVITRKHPLTPVNERQRVKTSTSTSTSFSNSKTSKIVDTKVSTSTVAKKSTAADGRVGNFDAVDLDDVLRCLARSTLMRWTTLYPDEEFLKRETIKGVGYYFDNTRKKPKSRTGWSRALGAWYEKAWTKQAMFTKGKAGTGFSWDSIFEEGK